MTSLLDGKSLFVALPDGRFIGVPLALSDDSDGHWITMDGEHVFIKGGKIEKGPAHLVGKKPSELPENGRLIHKAVPSTKNVTLTQTDRNAIADYSGDKFQKINSYLRAGKSGDKDLDRNIAGLDKALAKIPEHEGDVYRSVRLTPEIESQIKSGTLKDAAYGSATTTPGIGHKFPTKGKATIQIKGGGTHNISAHSVNRGEHETIIPRGHELHVESVKDSGFGGIHVIARLK